jgi:hypothetical protein
LLGGYAALCPLASLPIEQLTKKLNILMILAKTIFPDEGKTIRYPLFI